MTQMNIKPWRMHQQTVDEALKPSRNTNVYRDDQPYDPNLEGLKMAGSKRVANPNEVFFVWYENNYGNIETPPTEHGTLLEALDRAAELDEEENDIGDGEIYVIRGERIPVKKKTEFTVDTD